MSSDYRAILQVYGTVSPERLERAYESSRLRFLRLTVSSSPLRFFRVELLADAERAYRGLREARSLGQLRPMSPLARQAAPQRGTGRSELSVKSAISKGTILSSAALAVTGRTVAALRRAGSTVGAGVHSREQRSGESSRSSNKVQGQRQQRALVEDRFCREVIYRLEGDLIRYDSRRELLQIAYERGIGLFRANMLIAQIVEAVRSHRLYKPGRSERRFRRGGGLGLGGLMLAAGLALLIDIVLICLLGL